MQPESWSRLKEIFGEAEELSSAAREEYIRNACAGDEALEREVRRLLSGHDEAGGFLSNPVIRASGNDSHPRFGAGKVLSGRFRIVRFIARGGMGEVYEAEDLTLHERVALKLIRPSLASSDKALDLFRREIQLSRKVTHPNVCRVFDVERHEDTAGTVHFLTMELVEGQTLARRLAECGPMPPDEALPLAAQMAAALDAAHAVGVIHRDFKPGNVVLAGDPPRAVVTDFGLALRATASEGARSSSSGGTPRYMAPERKRGGQITAAVDVWAFGVVLEEMTRGPVPAAWKSAVDRCRHDDPARRFASAGEAGRELASALRKPARWTGIALALAVALFGSVLLLLPAQTIKPRIVSSVSLTRVLEHGRADTLAISPNGDLAAIRVNESGEVALRDLGTGSTRRLLLRPKQFPMTAIFSPDGRRLAVELHQGGSNSRLLVIDIGTGEMKSLLDDPRIKECKPLDWSRRRDEILLIIVDASIRLRYAILPIAGGGLQFLAQPGELFGHGIFSPDGESVVYSAPQRGEEIGNDLFVMPRGGGPSVPVVELPADEAVVAFSPTGQTLFFRSDQSLFAVGWEGGKASGQPSPLYKDLGVFSPLRLTDSGELFLERLSGESNVFMVQIDPERGLTLNPPRRMGKRITGSGRSPAWSPSGRLLIYLRDNPGYGLTLEIFDRTTGKTREVAVRLPVFLRPQWLGGERYAAGPGILPNGKRGHIRIDTATGEAEMIAAAEEMRSFFEGIWTRDGRTHFNRFQDSSLGLFRFDFPERRRTILYVPPPEMNLGRENIRLSPDEKTLAFHLFSRNREEAHLLTMPATGGEPRRLWSVRKPYWFMFGSFTWTPDGRAIVAARSKEQEGADLWYVPVSGDPPRPIEFPRQRMSGLQLNPDGRTLAFFGGDRSSAVWVVKGALSSLR